MHTDATRMTNNYSALIILLQFMTIATKDILGYDHTVSSRIFQISQPSPYLTLVMNLAHCSGMKLKQGH